MNRGIKDSSSSSGEALRMNCPECNSDQNIIKAGLRDTQKGTIQRYYCKDCEKYFSESKQNYS